MAALLEAYQHPLLVFMLVLTRVSGLVMTAPLLGARNIPSRIRALLAVAISVLVAPLQFGTSFEDPENIARLVLLLGQELLLGLAMGMGTVILFAGIQLVGQILGQMSGMQLADVFDPTFDGNVPVYGQLLDFTSMAVFVCIGGHRLMLAALLDTFTTFPPGAAQLPSGLVEVITTVLAQSFVLGIRAAAPTMLALLMAVLITGLITRTLPQLNVNAIGYGLNAIVMPLGMAFSLGLIVWIFEDHARSTLTLVQQWLAGN